MVYNSRFNNNSYRWIERCIVEHITNLPGPSQRRSPIQLTEISRYDRSLFIRVAVLSLTDCWRTLTCLIFRMKKSREYTRTRVERVRNTILKICACGFKRYESTILNTFLYHFILIKKILEFYWNLWKFFI